MKGYDSGAKNGRIIDLGYVCIYIAFGVWPGKVES